MTGLSFIYYRIVDLRTKLVVFKIRIFQRNGLSFMFLTY